MTDRILGDAVTFDDVLLLPAYSGVLPSQVNTQTWFTRSVRLNVPIVSSAMDTVTESRMAIAMAQEGGIGVIHKNMSIDDQAREVVKVKRSENGVITDPICLPPHERIGTARRLMRENNISGIPVVQEGNQLVGILTNRDLRFYRGEDRRISEVMTHENLITAPVGTTLEQAQVQLDENKVEKLLLIDQQGRLQGLITKKDIDKMVRYPQASKDERGRLRLGAAVGVHDFERAERLVRSDVDVLVLDTAHGHSANVLETLRELRKQFDIEVVAGNVATAEGVRDLAQAGAAAVKVGIGPGSICTTRMIAGVGVPQVTAIMESAREAARHEVPLLADGGVKYSGDITKALASGASAVMVGGLFAGVEESPGERITFKGRAYKAYRGMGSLGAMVDGSSDRYAQQEQRSDKLVPEGVEGRVPFRGPLAEFVYQLVGGLRAGMGYCGARDIPDLQAKARFMRISPAGLRESHPHDIVITHEAPNYWVD